MINTIFQLMAEYDRLYRKPFGFFISIVLCSDESGHFDLGNEIPRSDFNDLEEAVAWLRKQV